MVFRADKEHEHKETTALLGKKEGESSHGTTENGEPLPFFQSRTFGVLLITLSGTTRNYTFSVLYIQCTIQYTFSVLNIKCTIQYTFSVLFVQSSKLLIRSYFIWSECHNGFYGV